MISRVVERPFAFGAEGKEKFCRLMPMMENLTSCRVLSYCLISNHFHIFLGVPPAAVDGLSNSALLKRFEVFYPPWKVRADRQNLETARASRGESELPRIHDSFLLGCTIWASS